MTIDSNVTDNEENEPRHANDMMFQTEVDVEPLRKPAPVLQIPTNIEKTIE